MAGTARDVNRTARENAVKKFNELAERLGVDTVPVRAKIDDVVALYKTLCKKVAPDMVEELLAANLQGAGLLQRRPIILNKRRVALALVAFVSHPVFYLIL